jgi:hypothetical protein
LLKRILGAASPRARSSHRNGRPATPLPLLRALPGLAVALAPAAGLAPIGATAHEIAGNRFFPATLAIDDPGVNDELAMPTVSVTKSGDEPPVKQLAISGEYAKRLTEQLAISIAPAWTHLYAPGGPNGNGASGFLNTETTLKYRFFRDPLHEIVMSAGLSVDWGGSGAEGVGGEKFTTYTPTFYFGKGFGDLPQQLWLARPLALTGTVGYSVPGSSQTVTADGIDYHPQFVNWGLSLQYSMPYLKSAVYDFDLPDILNHLIPLVEASFQSPAANLTGTNPKTTGTINPGVIYVSNYYQVGLEAIVPINRDSGRSVGAIAQLHIYLDDLMPTSLGKPLFGGPVAPARPF